MSSFRVLTTLLAVLASSSTSVVDDDFGFDLTDDLEIEFAQPLVTVDPKAIPNTTATVGKLFHVAVTKDVFGKDTKGYEAKINNNDPLPSWLLFDKTEGIFWGVPLADDSGVLHVSIKPIGQSEHNKQEFNLVVEEKSLEEEQRSPNVCPVTEDSTILSLLIDRDVQAIKPKQRIIAISNIAKFLGLPYSAFKLSALTEADDITDSSVVLAGPGNLHSRSSKQTSMLQLIVGCDGRLWVETAPLVHQLKQQARDGTISEVMQLPLIGWRVKTETRPALRNKREVDDYGSGDYDYDDQYDEYDDEDIADNEKPVEKAKVSTKATTTTAVISTPSTEATTTSSTTTESHPHRHHHGELKPLEPDVHAVNQPPVYQAIPETSINITSNIIEDTLPEVTLPITPLTVLTSSTEKLTTPEKVTERTVVSSSPSSSTTYRSTVRQPEATTNQASVLESEKTSDYDNYDYEDEDDEESETVVPESTTKKKTLVTDIIEIDTEEPVFEVTFKPKVTTTTENPEIATVSVLVTESETALKETPPTTLEETQSTLDFNVTKVPLTAATTPTTTTTTTTTTFRTTTETEEEDTTLKQTTLRHVASTPKTTATVHQYTESIEYEVKNFPPTIQNRLKRLPVTAGKMFSYIIPQDTFTDMEDGTNLLLEFLSSDGQPVKNDSWCQFNARKREIYGLPLDEDVSRWEYTVRATDKEGASTSDRLEILVQQHKAKRVVNHEFSLLMRIEKRQEFPHSVDWPLKVLRDLSRLYHSNMSEITVRSVNYTSDPVVFTWTNDSLPTNYCPESEISHMYRTLTANDRGDPSFPLNLALAPEIRVKQVLYKGLGVCEPQPKPPMTPPTNFSPILRNPVDHINATVGELLVYRVPDDTFYDPEDVDSRMLNITLLKPNRQPIPADNWLQFDSKNREFYGIPKKPGRSEYQLECTDSGGLQATDSLELVVYPPPKIQYNVEFGMHLEVPYNMFVNSAKKQREFVEKLQELFGDRNSSYIYLNLNRDKHDTTIATWYNKSLTTEKCPQEEINRLESILKHNDRTVSSRVHGIMGADFPVTAVKTTLLHNCKSKSKAYVPPPVEVLPGNDEVTEQTNSREFLITIVVPTVVISIMLFLAGIGACILYRRKRTGKMNVEEDGRKSYGNKGIPVIFQEELDEKPESGTKTPVILKDEKPPLAPPEYSKSGSLKLTDDSEPYQPPPPFTRTQDNGRQPRPKPTPTYRKPPPYVPP